MLLQFIIVYGLMGYEPLTYENYVYPVWANVLGWLIATSSIAMIPGVAIYKIIVTPGSFMQVINLDLKLILFSLFLCRDNLKYNRFRVIETEDSHHPLEGYPTKKRGLVVIGSKRSCSS